MDGDVINSMQNIVRLVAKYYFLYVCVYSKNSGTPYVLSATSGNMDRLVQCYLDANVILAQLTSSRGMAHIRAV